MIEKIIHIYHGETFGESKYLIDNKTLLPNYQFIEWDDSKLLDFCKTAGLPEDNLMIRTVCKKGGFFVDSNYKFLKNIDIFLGYDFISVFDNNDKLKFYGSKKNNKIINNICSTNGIYDDKYILEYKNNKIINPIYFYPQKKTKLYKIIEVNKDYMFGANTIDSSWVFNDKLTDMRSWCNYNTKPYRLLSDTSYSCIRPEQNRNILVVVAHPDDDLLFFGELLIYRHNLIKVICATCSSKNKRNNEFINIMQQLDVDYEIWDIADYKSYADCDILRNKLREAIKGFNIFFTHSLSGETGHPTHILLNKIMFDIVPVNLFVANPYRQKPFLHPKKMELLKIYQSQKRTIQFNKDNTSKEDYLRIK